MSKSSFSTAFSFFFLISSISASTAATSFGKADSSVESASFFASFSSSFFCFLDSLGFLLLLPPCPPRLELVCLFVHREHFCLVHPRHILLNHVPAPLDCFHGVFHSITEISAILEFLSTFLHRSKESTKAFESLLIFVLFCATFIRPLFDFTA